MKVLTAKSGDVFYGKNIELRVLAPGKEARGENVNEEGMVLEMVYGSFKGIFTGDIGIETEEKLLEEKVLEDVSYLKVGHHGSGYSTGEAFLQTILPEFAVISVSETNTYGHPSGETMQRLQKAGAKVYCTKDRGAVTAEVSRSGTVSIKSYLEKRK